MIHRCQHCKRFYENSKHHYLCEECWIKKKDKQFQKDINKKRFREKEI